MRDRGETSVRRQASEFSDALFQPDSVQLRGGTAATNNRIPNLRGKPPNMEGCRDVNFLCSAQTCCPQITQVESGMRHAQNRDRDRNRDSIAIPISILAGRWVGHGPFIKAVRAGNVCPGRQVHNHRARINDAIRATRQSHPEGSPTLTASYALCLVNPTPSSRLQLPNQR